MLGMETVPQGPGMSRHFPEEEVKESRTLWLLGCQQQGAGMDGLVKDTG